MKSENLIINRRMEIFKAVQKEFLDEETKVFHVLSAAEALPMLNTNNYSLNTLHVLLSDHSGYDTLHQAALAAVGNMEGAKIQAAVAMGSIKQQELLCLNKSVADMMDSIAMLESILK